MVKHFTRIESINSPLFPLFNCAFLHVEVQIGQNPFCKLPLVVNLLVGDLVLEEEAHIRVWRTLILVPVSDQSDSRVAAEGGLVQLNRWVEQGDVRVESYYVGGDLVMGLAGAASTSK